MSRRRKSTSRGVSTISGITPTIAITQAEIPGLQSSLRITAYPVIVRVARQQLGGGFGDHSRRPYTWTVMLQVDGQWAEVVSARGSVREWGSLDRLERWLRSQGFRYSWLQNELEPSEETDIPTLPSSPFQKS